MGAEGAIDFRLLFEASPDVLLVLLPDAPRYTMVAATRARFAATHTTPDTLGKGLFEVFPDNPDDPAATGMRNLRISLEQVLATRAPDTMAVQKYDIRGPDGSFQVKYWSPRNLPVLSPSGEVLYILHRVEDVTELVQASELGEELRDRTRQMEREVVARSRELAEANAELRAANLKLGELDAAKTAFFSNVSHEFRTPLTLMLGPIEDLLAGEPAAPRRRLLELVHDHALRLFKLVNALLDFSRLEAGRLRAHHAPLDLGQLTAELAEMFRSAADRASLRFTVECRSTSEPAWVDRDMWEKIVPNLVSNAFKFTYEGEIAVRLREQRDAFVLEVADTGIGIAEAELPRIFERFHRVAGAQGRTHEGTGIGLSLVRELVMLHRGTVTVESEPGKGSTFHVTIPKGFAHLPSDAVSHEPARPNPSSDATAHAAEVAHWVAPRVSEAIEPQPPDDSAPRPRVLVVDDNADLRGYIGALLSPTYDVATAVDGQAALELIRQAPPEIVVSDIMMPRLDGLGLVRALRDDPKTALLPVILLSARAGEEAAIDGLSAGSDDYLVKPFSARELVARVRTHLELSRARRSWVEQLEQKNRELDAFSYSVSHDLRAPLRAIDGFSRALEQDCAELLGEDGSRYLQRILYNVRRMDRLIDDLLTLSRVGRVELRVGQVSLSALAEDVVSELRRAEPNRDAHVEIEADLLARGDSALLRVVLVNLIGNAWKFTSKREQTRISFGRGASAPRAFFVRDNGAGFDMAYAERLFTPFQRLHSAGEFDGTGVGLSTVQRIVQRHGGRIWVEAEPARGATFFFTLSELR